MAAVVERMARVVRGSSHGPIEVVDVTAEPRRARLMGQRVLGNSAIDCLDLNPNEAFMYRPGPGRALEIGTRLRWRC